MFVGAPTFGRRMLVDRSHLTHPRSASNDIPFQIGIHGHNSGVGRSSPFPNLDIDLAFGGTEILEDCGKPPCWLADLGQGTSVVQKRVDGNTEGEKVASQKKRRGEHVVRYNGSQGE